MCRCTERGIPDSQNGLGPCYSKCGPGSHRIGIIWGLVGNVESQSPARPTEL